MFSCLYYRKPLQELQFSDINVNNTREWTKNLMEESVNVEKTQDSLNNSRWVRRKKFYTDRGSPIDIVEVRFKENSTDEMKKGFISCL